MKKLLIILLCLPNIIHSQVKVFDLYDKIKNSQIIPVESLDKWPYSSWLLNSEKKTYNGNLFTGFTLEKSSKFLQSNYIESMVFNLGSGDRPRTCFGKTNDLFLSNLTMLAFNVKEMEENALRNDLGEKYYKSEVNEMTYYLKGVPLFIVSISDNGIKSVIDIIDTEFNNPRSSNYEYKAISFYYPNDNIASYTRIIPRNPVGRSLLYRNEYFKDGNIFAELSFSYDFDIYQKFDKVEKDPGYISRLKVFDSRQDLIEIFDVEREKDSIYFKDKLLIKQKQNFYDSDFKHKILTPETYPPYFVEGNLQGYSYEEVLVAAQKKDLSVSEYVKKYNIKRSCFIDGRFFRDKIDVDFHPIVGYHFLEVDIYNLENFVTIFLNDLYDNNQVNSKSREQFHSDENIKIIFEELEGNKIALAYGKDIDGEIYIKVDPTNWKNSSIEKKWYIIYHELGHDVLNLNHGQAGKMMFNFADREYNWLEFYQDKKEMFNYHRPIHFKNLNKKTN